MYSSILSTLVLCFALLNAVIASPSSRTQRQPLTHPAQRRSTNLSNTTTVTSTRNSTVSVGQMKASGPQASLLFAGLGANIDAQQGQLYALESIISLQATLQSINSTANSTVKHRLRFDNTTTDAAPYFLAAKQTLLAFTRASAQIRQANMFLANINPQIERGLAQFETEQVREYMLANRLSGDKQTDDVILQQLKGSLQQAVQRTRALQRIATGGAFLPNDSKASIRKHS